MLRTGSLLLIALALAVAFYTVFYSNGTAPAQERETTAAIAVAIVAGFGLFVLLPMLPGFLEVRRSRDATSLTIDQNYSRDPRYMGKSFREKISSVLDSAPMHTRMPFLSRSKEFARVVPSLDLEDDEVWTDAVLSKGNVNTGNRASLVDLYSQGDVRIGAGSKLRTLAADGDVQLGANVSLMRWIDAEKSVRVGPNSNLGHSVSAVGPILLATDVEFRRLCGNPIVVGNVRSDALEAPAQPAKWLSSRKRRITSVKDTVGRGETVSGDMISRGGVELRENAVVQGSVKSGGDVVVGPGAIIEGNVVARGVVVIRSGGTIRGHVFAEGNVIMAKDSVVGASGAAKTLYSSRDICLAEGSRIYGWVICEDTGTTVATATTA
jgi:predicted acyltransferase (DUF342 family)